MEMEWVKAREKVWDRAVHGVAAWVADAVPDLRASASVRHAAMKSLMNRVCHATQIPVRHAGA